ncbi:hypothetical protein SODG_002478 [Sodalis praecaptivus]
MPATESSRGAPPRLKRALWSDILQSVGILPMLIVIVAVFGVVTPNFSPTPICSILPARRRSTSCWRRG